MPLIVILKGGGNLHAALLGDSLLPFNKLSFKYEN